MYRCHLITCCLDLLTHLYNFTITKDFGGFIPLYYLFVLLGRNEQVLLDFFVGFF